MDIGERSLDSSYRSLDSDHMKNKTKEVLQTYVALTDGINGTDLFELYAIYKKEGLCKSPSGFQKLLNNQAKEYIKSLVQEKIKA